MIVLDRLNVDFSHRSYRSPQFGEISKHISLQIETDIQCCVDWKVSECVGSVKYFIKEFFPVVRS